MRAYAGLLVEVYEDSGVCLSRARTKTTMNAFGGTFTCILHSSRFSKDLSETENRFLCSLPNSPETEKRFRSVQRRKLKTVSAVLCRPRRKLKTVSVKEHQGVSLLTPLSTPRSCVELSCIGSTQERSRNSSGASQSEALTAMFEIGVSPVRSPTRSYITKCIASRASRRKSSI